MQQKLQRLALILIVMFSTTGCAEMVYGVICVGGIIFSSDTRHDVRDWPDAHVGEPYQATLYIGELMEPEFTQTEKLPDGLMLSFWYKSHDLSAGPPPLVNRPAISRDVDETYLRLEGTPRKAGKYRFSVISHYMPSMCGGGDGVHPQRIRVK